RQHAEGHPHFHLFAGRHRFLYLAVVIDAYSRKVMGWAMADHLRAAARLQTAPGAIEAVRSTNVPHPSTQASSRLVGDRVAVAW
ncbi:MAG: hypothetical protein WD942_03160, partial [Dehalococcoidia bacterium]